MLVIADSSRVYLSKQAIIVVQKKRPFHHLPRPHLEARNYKLLIVGVDECDCVAVPKVSIIS